MEHSISSNGPSVDRLIDRAIALTGVDDDARGEVAAALHVIGDETVFTKAISLLASESASERTLGADILGQLGAPEARPFLEQTLAALQDLCARDQDPDVLSAAVVAFGHLADSRALPCVLTFVAHDDPDLRHSVAFALPSLIDEQNRADQRGIEALVTLTTDPDDDVRDWATFGLGSQVQADTPRVRGALADRLDDDNPDVAGEALVGLARRADRRASDVVRRRLADHDADVFVLEAAAELGDPSDSNLLALLNALDVTGWDLAGPEHRLLRTALDQCGPGGA